MMERKSVLIVESHEDLCNAILASLRAEGFSCQGFDSVDAALPTWSTESPCIVCVEERAYHHVRELVPQDVLDESPLLVMAADPRARFPGAEAVLHKPFRVERLCHEIAEHCRRLH